MSDWEDAGAYLAAVSCCLLFGVIAKTGSDRTSFEARTVASYVLATILNSLRWRAHATFELEDIAPVLYSFPRMPEFDGSAKLPQYFAMLSVEKDGARR
jgi:hypothetical protein